MIQTYLELEAINDVLDVGAGQRLSKAQLFGKVDLCVELMELLKEVLLRHRTFHDGAAATGQHHQPNSTGFLLR